MRFRLSVLVLTAAIASLFSVATPAPAAAVRTFTGTLDGAPYQIEVPQPWNGTLVLWSHGYEAPSSGPQALPADAPDSESRAWLLGGGYALAASGYSRQGWAVAQALQDQIALLDRFDALGVGRPRRTIAWGASMGGLITAGLIQLHPARFAAAIPMCGVLAGAVGFWNESFDTAFVFRTLLAPASSLQLIDITDPAANFRLAADVLRAAQATPRGRARLALAAAVGDVPGWFATGSPEPAEGDLAAQELGQFQWDESLDLFFAFYFRQDLESRAGGNPSWNSGVDYQAQLERSVDRDEVVALYRQAGLSLDRDLRTLAEAPRIEADPKAVDYLEGSLVLDGQIHEPVLTLHTIGDGLVPNEDEQAYAGVVDAAGDAGLLRQAFVAGAGHCSFTPAEEIGAFQTVIGRLDTGRWGDSTSPAGLSAAAAATGLGRSAFVLFQPSTFLRPFDARQELVQARQVRAPNL